MSNDFMKDRIKRVFSNLDDKVDAVLISNAEHPSIDLNFFYITGIRSGSFAHAYALVKRNGDKILITNQLEEQIAREESDFQVVIVKSKDDMKKLLSGIKVLGINFEGITHAKFSKAKGYTKAKIVDVSSALCEARSIKDKKEIENISKACEISVYVAGMIPSLVTKGMTERELAGRMNSVMMEKATGLAFPTIVAFGTNSSKPHYLPSDSRLGKNQFVLADFGAEVDRYASDITRTFIFRKASKEMREMYETVLDAQMQAIDMVKDGVNGREIDKFARDIVERNYKGMFIHNLGHEVGMSVHDGRSLGPNSDFMLKENMVVTVEPGVYIPSIGGVRIEDTVVVRKGKAKVLTNSTKDLIQLQT